MVKATYGTGCFALLNTGDKPVASNNRLLTTVAYQLDGKRTYALEGAIFIAGAAVQWLRDGLRIIASAPESGALAASGRSRRRTSISCRRSSGSARPTGSRRRAARCSASRARTGPAEIARAALEAVCYQTRDLLRGHARRLVGRAKSVLRVDGGMVASDWTMQCLADILDAPVERPTIRETTALGAAWLAGHKAGVWPDAEGFGKLWKLERAFTPALAGGRARAQVCRLAARRRGRAANRQGATEGSEP